MDRRDILTQLSDRSAYPADTVRYCLDHADRTTSVFVPLLRKSAENNPIETVEEDALFLGLHVMGELRIRSAFSPLLELSLKHPETLVRIFGEAGIGATLPRVLMCLCQDQSDKLWQVVQSQHLDFLIRDAFLRAWTFEVFEGRVSQAVAVQKLSHMLNDETAPIPSDPIWNGWLTAIADLGFKDLESVANQAVSTGQILADPGDLPDIEIRDFEAAMLETQASEDRSALQVQRGYVPFGDAPGDWGKAFVNAPN
ncbi:MAG: DUF1186 domain-containing protein [Roseibium sp.]